MPTTGQPPRRSGQLRARWTILALTCAVLLTGTGVVPPDEYTLEPGHVVAIEIDGIGVLVNTVA